MVKTISYVKYQSSQDFNISTQLINNLLVQDLFKQKVIKNKKIKFIKEKEKSLIEFKMNLFKEFTNKQYLV